LPHIRIQEEILQILASSAPLNVSQINGSEGDNFYPSSNCVRIILNRCDKDKFLCGGGDDNNAGGGDADGEIDGKYAEFVETSTHQGLSVFQEINFITFILPET
jgi:hypothetical protein